MRDVAEPALEELDRIGRLVGDLLAFARREDVLAREDLDVAAVCRDALARVAPLCEVAQVADDGPGIDPERLETVFEPFHTSKREGTGLGLAIACRLARAHGGDVRVSSALGHGTLLRLTLPRAG